MTIPTGFALTQRDSATGPWYTLDNDRFSITFAGPEFILFDRTAPDFKGCGFFNPARAGEFDSIEKAMAAVECLTPCPRVHAMPEVFTSEEGDTLTVMVTIARERQRPSKHTFRFPRFAGDGIRRDPMYSTDGLYPKESRIKNGRAYPVFHARRCAEIAAERLNARIEREASTARAA